MGKKIVLAGGTGFVGRYFQEQFRALGYEVYVISRQKGQGFVGWGDMKELTRILNGSELLLNLAGKSVNCRYHQRNQREILLSRTETTSKLGQAVAACTEPPPLWINASTATIYRHAEDHPMTEAEGEKGTGFSVDVANAWEEAFFACKLPATRQVALRMAIVLGANGGVMTPYRYLVRFGLGGIQGNGRQMFSWIHLEDLFRLVGFIQEHKELSGVFNAAAPHPVSNRQLMKELRKAFRMPVGLPAPAWLLEIGAVLIRTETELILKSRWVVPKRLLEAGFVFRYPRLADALQQIVRG
ncbi:TIGR01777 family oxidoreductase [Paenibacillus senegalensis]|uniref:TIGR01777 family oxidoreductase n=1 Tax=Paenibacillus senegalensis TaxID=1465766 RepID=UPI00030F66C1|nr:TIGR01777 family oxidoreductase [Paenibacillus senegalensis]